MKNSLDPKYISKLADDIRTIQNFTMSENFDTNLLRPEVASGGKGILTNDPPMICAIVSTLLIVCCLAVLAYSEALSAKAQNLIFVIGLIFATVSTMAMHKKFSNLTITVVCAIGLATVMLIGSGNLTPKEAAEIAQKMRQSEAK